MADHILTTETIREYADLSHDHNPLHVDEVAAARSPFGSIVAHGFLLLGGPLAALAADDRYPKALECTFTAPGRPGDVVRTELGPGGAFTVRIGDAAAVSGRLEAGE